jgi:GTP-binding protein LepA
LEVLPVINKIDLPSAEPANVQREIENTIGLDCSNSLLCSAKTGQGVTEILEAVIKHIPPPQGVLEKPLRALIFDSYFDTFKGVVVFCRIVDGSVKVGDHIRLMNANAEFEVLELGVMTPTQVKVASLRAGEVGYIAAAIKSVEDARVGDTITLAKDYERVEILPGYAPAKQMVFAGLYPSESNDYDELKDSLAKLKLNDASFSFTPEVSSAMGFGFRCGFLGLLHMDIIQERLEREYDLDLIITAPSVVYKIVKNDGSEELVDTPAKLPDPVLFESIMEPYVRLEMITPSEYNGPLMELAQSRRAHFIDMKYVTQSRVSLIYEVSFCKERVFFIYFF